MLSAYELCSCVTIVWCLALTTQHIHQFLPQPRHLQEACQQKHLLRAGSCCRRAVVSVMCVVWDQETFLTKDLTSITWFHLTASSPSTSHQSSGADGRHPEAADGPGVHVGVQRRAQSRPRAPQEHPGQGGAEEAAALHQLAQAAGCPRRLGQVNADEVSRLAVELECLANVD